MSGGSSFSTPQTNFLQKQKEMREQQLHQSSSSASSAHSPPQLQQQQSQTAHSPNTTVYSPDKPPIPPRNVPPPVPQRQISNENSVTLRTRTGKLFEFEFRFILEKINFFFKF